MWFQNKNHLLNGIKLSFCRLEWTNENSSIKGMIRESLSLMLCTTLNKQSITTVFIDASHYFRNIKALLIFCFFSEVTRLQLSEHVLLYYSSNSRRWSISVTCCQNKPSCEVLEIPADGLHCSDCPGEPEDVANICNNWWLNELQH